jgi:HK97 family phage prohead protease
LQTFPSSIEVKSIDVDKREIEGWASTPTPDRAGDVINPTGLSFERETPLLLNHKSDQPVGTVQFGKPTTKGLPFKAQVAKIDEDGAVKRRTDEAWHSIKSGLIKGVSIGFIPAESKPLSTGGTYYSKASVHELSLTAIPCNPEATITAFKALDAAHTQEADNSVQQPKINMNITKGTDSMEKTNHNSSIFIRSAIAKALAAKGGETGFAAARWGDQSEVARYIKAAVGAMSAGPDATGALTAGAISRDYFVQAVFSRSILGQLQGLMRVPAITRINVETEPTAAAFFGAGTQCPAAQGAFGVQLADNRRIGVISVISQELMLATDDGAESAVTGILQRALSRGLDSAFVGSQTRDNVSPAGLASIAAQASSFAAGVEAFTGDLTMASVLVNPRTAITLRSPTETQITAQGGMYGGLPAIASVAVPLGKLYIVDGSRVLTYLGAAEIHPFTHMDVYGLAGVAANVPVNMFQTSQVALAAGQYADWSFVDGAAVAVTVQ